MTKQDPRNGAAVTGDSTPTSSDRAGFAERPRYDSPSVFVIGKSNELLRGSGRHKYDDTGGRGFVVG